MTSRVDAAFKPTATFSAGQSVTPAIEVGKLGAEGLALNIQATNWTAADIGFQVSEDGTTWTTLNDTSGNPVKVTGISTSAAGQYTVLADIIAGLTARYLRLVSRNTATFATPVNQANAITVTLVTLDQSPSGASAASLSSSSALGATTDTAVKTDANGSINAHIRGLVALLAAAIDGSGRLIVSLGTLIHGEDETNNVLAVAIKPVLDSAYGDSFVNYVAANAGAAVKASPGHLKRVQINTPVASGTVTIYNNASSASTPIGKVTLPATLLQNGPLPPMDYGDQGVFCSAGIYIVITGTMDVTVVYN